MKRTHRRPRQGLNSGRRVPFRFPAGVPRAIHLAGAGDSGTGAVEAFEIAEAAAVDIGEGQVREIQIVDTPGGGVGGVALCSPCRKKTSSKPYRWPSAAWTLLVVPPWCGNRDARNGRAETGNGIRAAPGGNRPPPSSSAGLHGRDWAASTRRGRATAIREPGLHGDHFDYRQRPAREHLHRAVGEVDVLQAERNLSRRRVQLQAAHPGCGHGSQRGDRAGRAVELHADLGARALPLVESEPRLVVGKWSSGGS